MSLEVDITEALQANLYKSNPALFVAEDALLSLASTDTVDGIFYAVVLKVALEESEVFVARYFEYGAFHEFFKSMAHSKLK